MRRMAEPTSEPNGTPNGKPNVEPNVNRLRAKAMLAFVYPHRHPHSAVKDQTPNEA
jgi:hypothetical protein